MYGSDQIQIEFQEQCMIGDQLRVESMLRSGFIDVNYQHKISGWTGLHWASKRDHEHICLILLAAGFCREVKDSKGRTPYEVCPASNSSLREILRPDNIDPEMPETSGSRAGSTESENGFVPSYIRHPPFPYASKPSSFENISSGSPNSPSTNGYYSYGRRDSLNKTRFLLLRTSFGDGKETYKRITLPGGSSVEQLKKLIEKATQKQVEAVITLPDNVLIENDDQIHEFGNCQKVEVIYSDTIQQTIIKAIESSPVKQEMEDKNDIINSSISSETPIDTSIVDIPSAEVDEPANETNGLTALTNNSVTSVLDHENQDDIPTTVVTDDALEATEEVGNKVDETSVSADSAPAKSAVDYRASIDSDPGDYVKVDHIESKQDDIPAVAESVQEKEEAIPVPAVVPAEIPKAVVLEKSKLEDQGGLIKWIDENPEKVRRAATVAAVASAAGLGYLIYARKFK